MTAAVCYIVCWRYGDNSAFGIVGHSFDKANAESMLKLLKDHASGKEFLIIESVAMPVFLP